jgi:hypothetical protein
MEVTRSSETSVYNKPTRCHIPEDWHSSFLMLIYALKFFYLMQLSNVIKVSEVHSVSIFSAYFGTCTPCKESPKSWINMNSQPPSKHNVIIKYCLLNGRAKLPHHFYTFSPVVLIAFFMFQIITSRKTSFANAIFTKTDVVYTEYLYIWFSKRA